MAGIEKKHKGNELAIFIFYHFPESLTFFSVIFFFFFGLVRHQERTWYHKCRKGIEFLIKLGHLR